MRRTLKGMGIALLIWWAVLLILPFVGPGGRQVAIVGNAAQAVRVVAAAGGVVVEVRRNAVLARSDTPGFPVALYRNGAWLVMEGRIAAACFSPASPQAR